MGCCSTCDSNKQSSHDTTRAPDEIFVSSHKSIAATSTATDTTTTSTATLEQGKDGGVMSTSFLSEAKVYRSFRDINTLAQSPLQPPLLEPPQQQPQQQHELCFQQADNNNDNNHEKQQQQQDAVPLPSPCGNHLHHEAANLRSMSSSDSSTDCDSPRCLGDDDERDNNAVFNQLPQFDSKTSRAAAAAGVQATLVTSADVPDAQSGDVNDNDVMNDPFQTARRHHCERAHNSKRHDEGQEEQLLLLFEYEMRQSRRFMPLDSPDTGAVIGSPLIRPNLSPNIGTGSTNSNNSSNKSNSDKDKNNNRLLVGPEAQHHRSVSSFFGMPPPSVSETQAEPLDNPSVLGSSRATDFAVPSIDDDG